MSSEPPSEGDGEVDLNSMTKSQLVEYGEEQGVILKMSMTKSTMIETLNEGE